MMNYKKSKEVKIPEQNVEVDPRSNTTTTSSNKSTICTDATTDGSRDRS